MQSILETAELVGLMGLAFSLAAGLEWALLQGMFRVLAARLQTPIKSVLSIAARKAQR
jgi:hypothetical protein